MGDHDIFAIFESYEYPLAAYGTIGMDRCAEAATPHTMRFPPPRLRSRTPSAAGHLWRGRRMARGSQRSPCPRAGKRGGAQGWSLDGTIYDHLCFYNWEKIQKDAEVLGVAPNPTIERCGGWGYETATLPDLSVYS